MTSEQKSRYETMLQMAKAELEHLDQELKDEVIRAKKRIEELQQTKKVVKQIYAAACGLLGIQSSLEMQEYQLEEVKKRA